MLEGMPVCVSFQGKAKGKDKHMQLGKLTREWESISKRKAKHIQKAGKICLKPMKSSGEGKCMQEREKME